MSVAFVAPSTLKRIGRRSWAVASALNPEAHWSPSILPPHQYRIENEPAVKEDVRFQGYRTDGELHGVEDQEEDLLSGRYDTSQVGSIYQHCGHRFKGALSAVL